MTATQQTNNNDSDLLQSFIQAVKAQNINDLYSAYEELAKSGIEDPTETIDKINKQLTKEENCWLIVASLSLTLTEQYED